MADFVDGKQPVNTDGIYDPSQNDNPSSTSVTASERNAAIGESTINKRITAVNGDDDKIALDVAISLGDGSGVDKDNPIPIYMTDSPADEIISHDSQTAVKDGGTANHDYVVSTGKEFRDLNISCSSAGFAKFELQISDDTVPTNFITQQVLFNSVSNPNVYFELKKPQPVAADFTIRIVKTNLDNQDTDLYSTINGTEN